MKRLFYSLLFLVSIGVYAQPLPSSIALNYGDKYQYKQQGDKVVVRTLIALGGADAAKVSVLVDGKAAETDRAAGDSLAVWLPMVGQPVDLKVYNGGRLIASELFTPLIPDDWGYFADGTIDIISSSHQDIAWMNTPDYCRHERIYDIVLPAMEMMKEDPTYHFGMEQTLNLMEVLDAEPSRKAEIEKLYKEQRFTWGATYNQPYEGLESGEQLARQIYYGRKWVKKNFDGVDDITAYNIDVPGRTWQMPQILAKGGVKNLFISRHSEGFEHWASPDGSTVLKYSPGNYGWPILMYKYFDFDAVRALNMLHPKTKIWSDYYRERNLPPHYAVVISVDASMPKNYRKVIDEWENIGKMAGVKLPKLRHTTVNKFLASIDVPQAKFDRIEGERPDLWLYIHGPAHYEAIKAKREAAVLLPAAEAFAAFDATIDGDMSRYPTAKLDSAWMASIYPDHGWGGKNGDITDSIFRAKLESGRDTGREIMQQSINSIASKIDMTGSNAVVVFNSLAWVRNDPASVEVAAGKPFSIVTAEGKPVDYQTYTADGKTFATFIAEGVPSLGYKTFYVKYGKKSAAKEPTAAITANSCDNRFYNMRLGNGGIISLTDKQLNKEVIRSTRFAGGDILNLGYFGHGAGEFVIPTQPTMDGYGRAGEKTANWRVTENGPVYTAFENRIAMAECELVQIFKVYHSIKKIEADVTMVDFDGTHNRQYRIAFPVNMDSRRLHYEVPMGVAEFGKDELKGSPGGWAWGGTYWQEPAAIVPREVQNFVSTSGEGFGFTMASGVAVADWVDPTREAVDYPVLQGIMLSSHKSCHGEGNWYEQRGTHRFSFAIASHPEGWKDGYRFATEHNTPLQTTVVQGKGTLPEQMSFLTVSDPLTAVSTVKKCDDSDELIIRTVDMEGRDKTVEIKLFTPISEAYKTDLIEENPVKIEAKTNGIDTKIGHHAIETFKFKPAKK